MTSGIAAVRRLDIQRVIIVDVALRARGHLACRRHLVRIRQRETRGRVIECRVGPVRGVVATGALRSREARGHVIRHRAAQGLRARPLRLVASVAVRICCRQRVVVVHMARRARCGQMRAGQRPARDAVIKRSRIPSNSRVALRAIRCRKSRSRRRVHRIIRPLPCTQVAAGIAAIRRLNLQVVVSVDVARRALHVGMAIRQQKARGAMVEFPVRPFRNRMARRTSGRGRGKTGRNVIRYAAAQSLRRIPIRRVACHAIRVA